MGKALTAKNGAAAQPGTPITLRCPACSHIGVFGGIVNANDVMFSHHENGRLHAYASGVRICPNPVCRTVVFVEIQNGHLRGSYPPELIDFDAKNLPQPILDTLKEAVSCVAAGAYRAAALMVRRLLEELCQDRGAEGRDLRARLDALGTQIVVPTELMEAANELRLLGNDAAHIEAKSYDDIGEPEARIAIELAKELLKATYQYASLVSRLRELKRPPNGS